MPTPNTGIPYVPENTIDPAAGLNLALNDLDALVQTQVLSIGANAPSGVPVDGEMHIVGTSPTGAWADQADNLARYVAEGGVWQFYEAGAQVRLILNMADGGLYRFDNGAWGLASGLPDAPLDGVAYVRKDGAWEPESGGGGGGASWGSITGTLSAQTDLSTALASKANTSSLAAIATSGAVSDLQSFPGGTTNFLRADGTFAAPPGGGGSGDVVGPASSVNDRIAVFDGTTGKLLKVGAQTIAQAIAAAQTPRVQAVTSSGTVTPTFANDLVKITAQAAALTLANPSGTAIDGHGIVIRIKDNGTARAITYGSQYRAIGVALPTTTVVGETIYIAGIWNTEDTTLDIVAVGQQA